MLGAVGKPDDGIMVAADSGRSGSTRLPSVASAAAIDDTESNAIAHDARVEIRIKGLIPASYAKRLNLLPLTEAVNVNYQNVCDKPLRFSNKRNLGYCRLRA